MTLHAPATIGRAGTFRRTERDNRVCVSVAARLMGDPPPHRCALVPERERFRSSIPVPPKSPVSAIPPKPHQRKRLFLWVQAGGKNVPASQETRAWARGLKERMVTADMERADVRTEALKRGVDLPANAISFVINAYHEPLPSTMALFDDIFRILELERGEG